MSATNFTPIQLYRTSTAAAVPTAGNLAAGELAINLTDERLYFKNAAGVVKLLASNSGALGTVTSVDVSGGTTGLTTSGGPITSSGTITLAGTLGVANGGTGTATAFTAGSVVFAGASGVYTQDNANLFWDNTNDRLGIGTASPSEKLEVSGSLKITGSSVNIAPSTGTNAAYVLNTNTSGNLFCAIDSSTGAAFGAGNYARVLYSSGAYPLAFFTNDAERMRIDSSGNVAVGTTTAASTAGKNITIGGVEPSLVLNATGGRSFSIASGNNFLYQGNTLAFIDNTAAATRMLINASGQVGIGTSSPGGTYGKLTVAGGVRTVEDTSSKLELGRFSSGAPNSYIKLSPNSASLRFTNAADDTDLMTLTNAGNLGIGTASPAAKLTISSAVPNVAGGQLIVKDPNYSGVALVQGGSGEGYLWNTSNNFLSIATNNTERMRIDSSGNVAIGTAATSSALCVARGAGVSAGISLRGGNVAEASEFWVSQGSGGTEAYLYNRANGPMIFGTNNTERARIDSSGNVLVGTTSVSDLSTGAASNPGFGVASGQVRSQWNADANAYWSKVNVSSSTVLHDFYVAGTRVGVITTNGSTTTYGTSSDARLKENIADADDAASLIDAIQVRKFDWKADNSHQRYGFVAQELLEVAPEAVTNLLDPDEMMGVDYSKLVPMLVKELQSLRARVAQLEGN